MSYELGAFGGFHGATSGQDRGMFHVFWLSGMSCDGCSVSALGANAPRVEELALGDIPEIPQVVLHHPMLDEEAGAGFMAAYRAAADGTLNAPYGIVVEGSIPDDQSFSGAGFYAAMGSGSDWPQSKGNVAAPEQPVRVTDWIWALAPRADLCIAIGTCATWGGIPAAAGNVTGSMGLTDYLGDTYRSARGVPVVNVPGCAPQGDNFTETLKELLAHLGGSREMPVFDELGRPAWLFGETVHRHCPKAGYYEEGVFAHEPGDNQCLVEIGCWGPVVQCNIVERGAVSHIGGCMVAGGACIGCTMPGFPDKYSPFYKAPPGSAISGTTSRITGGAIRRLRRMSMTNGNHTPLWDNAHEVPSAWGRAFEFKNPVTRVNSFFYKKLQYSGSVNHAKRNRHQPLPMSRDILRQKGVDLEASVPVLQEHLVSREEL
ncbi:MAG: hydrogenase expression protein HypE [Thermoleophilia bacterium]